MEFMSLGKIQSRHKVGLFVLSMIATIWLFYFFLLLPQWARIEHVTAQYSVERKRVKAVEAFAETHPNPEQSVIELTSKLAQADRMLPDNSDISSFIIDIEQLTKKCGIQLVSIKPVQIVTKDDYREYDIEIVIKGKFMKNMDFLNKSENGLRFINITNVDMNVCKEGVESKLLAKIYSYGVPVTDSEKITDVKNSNK